MKNQLTGIQDAIIEMADSGKDVTFPKSNLARMKDNILKSRQVESEYSEELELLKTLEQKRKDAFSGLTELATKRRLSTPRQQSYEGFISSAITDTLNFSSPLEGAARLDFIEQRLSELRQSLRALEAAANAIEDTPTEEA